MPNSWNSGYSGYNNPPSQRGGRGGRPYINRNNRHYGQENENEKRKRSFVIIGLRQLPGDVTEREMRDEDHTAAIDIVRYLGIPDDIPKLNVKRARNGPVLIVTLESIPSRDLILRRSHFLNRIEDTRHLKLEKAYTAEDMINRYGRLPNDDDLDDPNSDVNINRFGRIPNDRYAHARDNRNHDYHRNNEFDGYHNNRARATSRNNDFPHSFDDVDHGQQSGNNRGRGYSRSNANNYPTRGGAYRGTHDRTNSRNNDEYYNDGYSRDNFNYRQNNNDTYQSRNHRDEHEDGNRHNYHNRGNPRGSNTYRY